MYEQSAKPILLSVEPNKAKCEVTFKASTSRQSTPAQVYQEGASPLFQWMRTTQTDRFVIGSSDVRAECEANFAFGGAEYFISVIANLFFTCFIFNI